MEESGLIFVTGGARSGKSSFAERFTCKIASDYGGDLHYIATCRPADNEMRNRIYRHQQERKESVSEWKTWECPTDIQSLIPFFKKEDIVLLDCLTILLTNELFLDEHSWKHKDFQEKVMESILTGIEAVEQKVQAFVIVSNDVLNENIIDRSLVQTYGRLLGCLHQQIVKKARKAFLVESGIPVLMKGGRLDERAHDTWNSF
jgi:adenosylcobinamide kinase / adenosylcobinamide-phosphate guanylyltransferase